MWRLLLAPLVSAGLLWGSDAKPETGSVRAAASAMASERFGVFKLEALWLTAASDIGLQLRHCEAGRSAHPRRRGKPKRARSRTPREMTISWRLGSHKDTPLLI